VRIPDGARFAQRLNHAPAYTLFASGIKRSTAEISSAGQPDFSLL